MTSKRKKWTNEEDEHLVKILAGYDEDDINWEIISKEMETC